MNPQINQLMFGDKGSEGFLFNSIAPFNIVYVGIKIATDENLLSCLDEWGHMTIKRGQQVCILDSTIYIII